MAFEVLQNKPKLIDGDKTAVIDLDFVKYSAASVGDRRWIEVTHNETGKKREFDGREQFWGRVGSGGWFSATNQKRLSKGLVLLKTEDFTIEDKIEASEPIENILHTAKLMVDGALKASGAEQYIAYYGKGDSFRVELSTLLEYKGQRTALKPTYLDDVTEYLAHKFNGIKVTGIEADDAVVMECWGKPNYFILGIDKDYRGSGVNFFDVNNPSEGVIDTSGLGELRLKDNGKVTGKGLLFKLWQICSEDNVDNYKANCFSKIKWGAKSAYKALVDCKSEQEAWQATVDVFKKLYPEPVKVKGWRGDIILIDWLYVLQEMYNMAHLQRWENDTSLITDILKGYGVDYT